MNPRRSSTKRRAGTLLVTLSLAFAPHAASAGLATAVEEKVASVGVDAQLVQLLQLRLESRLTLSGRFRDGFPRALQFRLPASDGTMVERASSFLERYADLYAQGTNATGGRDHGLRLRAIGANEADGVVAFAQTWRGLPVFGAALSVFLSPTEIFGTTGALLTGPRMRPRAPIAPLLDVVPGITGSEAETAARQALGVQGFAIGTPVLGVFDPALIRGAAAQDSSPSLAWRVAFEDRGLRAYVDARTGQVLMFWSAHPDAFDLAIYDINQTSIGAIGCPAFWSQAVFVGDETGLQPAHAADPDAIQAADLTEQVYDGFSTRFGQDSYDDAGAQMGAVIHSTTPFVAVYNGGCNNLLEFGNGSAGLEVVAHEFTHAVIDHSNINGGITYFGQAGALNESLADVMAAIHDGNWTIGETTPGGAVRDMSDPPAFSHPDHVLSPYYFTGEGDWGGVHFNSGIPNKVAYLLAEGGEHYGITIDPIGEEKLAQLAYRLAIYLSPSSTFEDARHTAVFLTYLGAAGDAYGFVPEDICSVKNAWSSVGVGNSDIDCNGVEEAPDPDLDGDLVPNSEDNCALVPNPSQEEVVGDNDKDGNACDPDDDGDSRPDVTDNCPLKYNYTQTDTDLDGVGDACDDDDDDDDDALHAVDDNCPQHYNPEQVDADGDGIGDACDEDLDGDGVLNVDDNCPNDANANQQDTDGGGVGDACDAFPANSLNDGAVSASAHQHEVSLVATDDLDHYLQIVLHPCLRAPCPDEIGPIPPLQVRITGLPTETLAWVSSSTGLWVSQDRSDPQTRSLTFRAKPGEIYLLNFAVDPAVAGSSVVVSMDFVG